jgi:hypothetical protein
LASDYIHSYRCRLSEVPPVRLTSPPRGLRVSSGRLNGGIMHRAARFVGKVGGKDDIK